MDEIYKNLDLDNLEGEIWRDVVGYEGKYQVSSLGRVKSLNYNRTNQERILLLRINKDGYLIVSFHRNGKINTYTVHRLVANAFLDNPNNLPCVNHKDENPSNNSVSNLEWCTYQYNNTYGTCQQRRAEKLTNRQDLSKKVYQYTKDKQLIKIWDSTAECGRQGFNQSTVAACCLGKRKSHRGYIWSYTEIF